MTLDRAPSARWLVALGLAGMLGSFAWFASEFVRCVINNVWFDPNFSGWSAPVGHQLLQGRRLFDDLLLPLPPGSFVVMAWLESAFGNAQPHLLQENWVCAVCYMGMALASYAIARPLAGQRIALFTAACTLGWVSVWIKELAYDSLAELCAWASIAFLVRAWAGQPGHDDRRKLLSAGLLTGATLFFKQSTATGLFAGVIVAFVYLGIVERKNAALLRARGRGLLAYAAGTFAGVAACLGGVWALGGSPALFLASMFVDGPALKGGTETFAQRMAAGTVLQPFTPLSLGLLAVFSALVVRMSRHPRGFLLAPPDDATRARPLDVIAASALALLLFGGGALWLALRAPPSDAVTRLPVVLSLMFVALAGCLAVVLFFGNIAGRDPQSYAFNATALATLVLGSTVSLSMTSFNPAYENNAIIAVALVALFVSLDRARLSWLAWPVLAIGIAMPLGWRLPLAARATHDVGDDGFFAGMRVNDAGLEIVRAAKRARDLAGPDGEVLVLPEDPGLAALIDRPRPRLCGAIVFPDQYPARCVEHDLALLRRRPPAVVVLRPGDGDQLLWFTRTFQANSPTEQLMTAFFSSELPHYRQVASQRTRWMNGSTSLSIWQRDGVGHSTR